MSTAAAAAASPGGSPLTRLDMGLRAPPAPPQDGNVGGSHLSVWGVTPVHGLPRARVPQDKGEAMRRTESSQPIPGEEACQRADEVRSQRLEQTQTRRGACIEMPVHLDGPGRVDATHIHRPGMAVDTPLVLGLCGVESPEGLVLSACCWPSKADRIRSAQEEALMSINMLQRTGGPRGLAALRLRQRLVGGLPLPLKPGR